MRPCARTLGHIRRTRWNIAERGFALEYTGTASIPQRCSNTHFQTEDSRMNIKTTTVSSLSLALAAAAMFATAPAAHAGTTAKAQMGHCLGANACKGHGACKSAANACKGKNACKGQGFTVATAKNCKIAGGKFEMPMPSKTEANKA